MCNVDVCIHLMGMGKRVIPQATPFSSLQRAAHIYACVPARAFAPREPREDLPAYDRFAPIAGHRSVSRVREKSRLVHLPFACSICAFCAISFWGAIGLLCAPPADVNHCATCPLQCIYSRAGDYDFYGSQCWPQAL